MSIKSISILNHEKEMDHLLQSFLTNEFGLPVDILRSQEQIQALIGQPVLLLINEAHLKDDILKRLIAEKKLLHSICLGEPGVVGNLASTPLPLRVSSLVMKISSEFGIKPSVSRSASDYFPIPLHLFSNLKSTPCDVFIRLGKTEDDFRYVKRLYANHDLEQGEINKFLDRGVANFFIVNINKELFLDYVVSEISPVAKKPEVKEKKRGFVDISSDLHEIVGTLAAKSEISEKVVGMANENIKKMAHTVQNSKKLLSLLKDLLQAKGSFNYKHCFLNTILSYEVMKRTDLGKTSRLVDRHEMMSFVAFYHDILLRDEKLCRIRNKKEFYRASENLNEKEKLLVSQHAKIIADMLGEIKGTPSEASQILRQHHGMTNGIGFASSYSSSLPAFVIIFIVIEFFVFQILDPSDNDGELAKIFQLCDEEFTLPSYRKIVGILKEIFNFS